jgi:hypothetical protein
MKTTAKKPTKKKSGKAASKTAASPAPIVAPGSPKKYRVRIRMYRQGLGDCFLITFPRKGNEPFHLLIDCGVLARDAKFMTEIVQHIRDTVRNGKSKSKARLDVVVATHEHKDHLSGFNQARDVFNDDFDFGAVWLGWTENLTKPEIKKIKEAKKKTIAKLQAALASPLAAAAPQALEGVAELLGFSNDDAGSKTIAGALEYLKLRGKTAGDLRYLEPGTGPFDLVKGVRVYVLGPPRDPLLLKGSGVTERLKKEGVIYHLSRMGDYGIDALSAAVSSSLGADDTLRAAVSSSLEADGDLCNPFSAEHRIERASPYFTGIKAFVTDTYDDPEQEWRKIDHDWLNAFGQLALDLDSDTNNTSLVLAFEFAKTGEVLLFVGDAQVANWQSWANLEFTVPGRANPLPALDLLDRTVFYKVGHHCSHNATLRNGGLELMNREDLVAFIPLDKETAKNQGKHGWDMPAGPLFSALKRKTSERVVISDVNEPLPPKAADAGIIATDTYVDYFLK